MSQKRLIEKLERHIGFVHHRLNCDGNYFADCIRPWALELAMDHFAIGCQLMRESIKNESKLKEDGSFEKIEFPAPVLDAMKESFKAFNSFDVEEEEDFE